MIDPFRQQLQTAGQARRLAREYRRLAAELTEDAVHAAHGKVPVTQMAEDLGVTVQAVYDVVKRPSLDENIAQRRKDTAFKQRLQERHAREAALYERLGR